MRDSGSIPRSHSLLGYGGHLDYRWGTWHPIPTRISNRGSESDITRTKTGIAILGGFAESGWNGGLAREETAVVTFNVELRRIAHAKTCEVT